MNVYVSGNQVGVMWNDRGPVRVLDRDGAVTYQFRPPADSVKLCTDEDSFDDVLDDVLEAAVERVREIGKVQKLSAKKIEALVDAVRSVEA